MGYGRLLLKNGVVRKIFILIRLRRLSKLAKQGDFNGFVRFDAMGYFIASLTLLFSRPTLTLDIAPAGI